MFIVKIKTTLNDLGFQRSNLRACLDPERHSGEARRRGMDDGGGLSIPPETKRALKRQLSRDTHEGWEAFGRLQLHTLE